MDPKLIDPSTISYLSLSQQIWCCGFIFAPIVVCWFIWIICTRLIPWLTYEHEISRLRSKSKLLTDVPKAMVIDDYLTEDFIMSFDKILDFVVNAVRSEERAKYEKQAEAEAPTKPIYMNHFYVVKRAGELVKPSKTKAEHHREREKHYIDKLAEAEKELREKGVSVEAYDPTQNAYLQGSMQNVTSGAMTNVNTQFQPRIDQTLLDNVKTTKNKMLEHRSAAEQAEKWARAFSQAPEKEIRLSVEDIHYFRLDY